MKDEMLEIEGVIHSIHMNRWGEVMEAGDIEGQEEQYPLPGKEYVLQMVVAVDYTTTKSDKTKVRHTLKRIGGWKLVAVPQSGEPLEDKIQSLPEEPNEN